MDFFSRSLNQEYRDNGIIIQSLIPFVVKTKIARYTRLLQPFIMTSETYVRSALKTIGKSERCTGHIHFELIQLLFESSNFLSIILDIDILSMLFYYGAKTVMYFDRDNLRNNNKDD